MKQKRKFIKTILTTIVILLVAFSIVSFVVIKISFDDMFSRTVMRKYSAYLRYADVEEQYERELLPFMSGENQLQGYLYGAENTKGLVVISHGMGGGAEGYMAETIYFVDHGYQVFGFDNTGCYNSEGKDCGGLSQSVIDLDAALTYIEQEPRFEEIPILLYGHSWGGYAVTAILNYDHQIAASVSVAGYNKPMEMILEWTKGMMGGFAYVEYPYIYLYQRVLFGEDINMSAVDGINSTDTPVLIIHGNEDETVGYEGAGIIAYRDAITNPNVQYLVCDGEKQNDHNKLFMSLDAIEYMDGLQEEYDQLYEQYNEEIPEEVEVDFYAKVDKSRTSRLDENFMQSVISFYEAAIH